MPPPHPPEQGVDLDGLLFCLHDFFLFLGVDEIRRRSSSDDKPLRMVKTILHELCKLLVGGAARDGLEGGAGGGACFWVLRGRSGWRGWAGRGGGLAFGCRQGVRIGRWQPSQAGGQGWGAAQLWLGPLLSLHCNVVSLLPFASPTSPPQGYDIYLHADAIPGRDADPQPIIFAYISLNLQTLSQSGVIATPAGSSNGHARSAAATPSAASRSPASSEAGEVPPGGGGQPAAAAAAAAALSEGQKAQLKGRLKDVMSRLMQRDQSAAAMQELYVMRK
jgi:hypothetical protein